jgi:PEP-CTERM motif
LSYRVGCASRGRFVHRKQLQRRAAVAFVVTAVALAGMATWWTAPHHRAVLRYSPSWARIDPEWARGNTSQNLAFLAGGRGVKPEVGTGRLVYPYSVVPGGVRDARELREAAERDRTIARHYAGFDYVRARTFELREPRMVYLSYRIGDKIFWTRRQFTLRRGEILLTDGKMTARTRCANRVSAVPEQVISSEEPLPEQLEDPFEGGSARPMAFPENFQSALLARNGQSGLGMLGPPAIGTSGYGSSAGGGFPGIFPPPLPGTCVPTLKPFPKGPGELSQEADRSSKKNGCGPSSTPPPTPPASVPEPATVLLFTSGAAAVYVRYRQFRAQK